MRKSIVALSAWLAVASAPAAAQTRSFAGCWLQPAPMPTCAGYIVTEASAEFSLAPREDQANPRFVLSAGFMRNVDRASAVGAVAGWDVGRGWARPARVDARYRRWFGSSAIDIGAGVAQRGVTSLDGTGRSVRAYGPGAMVGAEWRYVALDLRGESLRAEGRSFNDMSLGARTTSIGAPIAVLAGLALIVVVVSQVDY